MTLEKHEDGWYHMPESALSYETWMLPFDEGAHFAPGIPQVVIVVSEGSFAVMQKLQPGYKEVGSYGSLEDAKREGRASIP